MPPRKRPPGATDASTQGHAPRQVIYTPRQFLDDFVRYLDGECGMSQNTIKAYRTDLERFLGWCQKKKLIELQKIDLKILGDYLEFLRAKRSIWPPVHRPESGLPQNVLPVPRPGGGTARECRRPAELSQAVAAPPPCPQPRKWSTSCSMPLKRRTGSPRDRAFLGAHVRHRLPCVGTGRSCGRATSTSMVELLPRAGQRE
ncbi:MAG: site-specific integrase [Planctomycetales bacterium]